MIITKTPLRISFLGGGTDYPEYYFDHGGCVLGSAIDKFVYVSVSRFYSELFDYCIRIAYRHVECVDSVDAIQHAPFRECLRGCGVTRDVEVTYMAELPSFSGLGTSSSFVVSLLQALEAFKGQSLRGMELAHRAIDIERDVLQESVGCQDQTFAAVGGFNLLEFRSNRDVVVHRVPLTAERQREIEAHVLLVFTGMQRRANDYAQRHVNRISENLQPLHRLRRLVDVGYSYLTDGGSLERFATVMNESWQIKRDLDKTIASDRTCQMYSDGMAAGAFGGKIIGAGGGGYLLLLVPPERRQDVRERLGHAQELAIRLNAPG